MQNAQEQSISQAIPARREGESLCLDLAAEIDSLHREPSWQNGISRKALVKYPDFRITLLTLKDKSRIEEHLNPGRISAHVISGHLRMRAGARTFDLPQGRILVLDRAVRHDVEALEDSAFPADDCASGRALRRRAAPGVATGALNWLQSEEDLCCKPKSRAAR